MKEKEEGRIEMKEKTMKRSRSRETPLSPPLASFTEDDFIVAEILANFQNLMPLSDCCTVSNWSRKRRRSCLDAAPSFRPSTSAQRTETKIEEAAVVIAKKDDGAAHPATSPNTPFALSPSDESVEKSSKKTSRKRSRGKYLDMIEIQTQTRDLLRGEIQNVNNYYQNLKSQNSELKAELQEAQRKVESQKEITGNHRINTASYQPAQDLEYSVDPIAAQSNNGNGSVNRVGPFRFDLNLPAEEEEDLPQPLDVIRMVADKRARFAEARRKRRDIIKIKSLRNRV